MLKAWEIDCKEKMIARNFLCLGNQIPMESVCKANNFCANTCQSQNPLFVFTHTLKFYPRFPQFLRYRQRNRNVHNNTPFQVFGHFNYTPFFKVLQGHTEAIFTQLLMLSIRFLLHYLFQFLLYI